LQKQQLPAEGLYFHTVIRRFASDLLTPELTQQLNIKRMQQLFYLAEVIKSGDRFDVRRLYQLRPDFFSRASDVSVNLQASLFSQGGGSTASATSGRLDVFASLYKGQAALRVGELDFHNFVQAAREFWMQMPDKVDVEREALVGMIA
jgi:hypothetical protein